MKRSTKGRAKRQPKSTGNNGLSPKEFTLLAIEKLRPGPGRGIHAVYSGFNEAFRMKFPTLDPVTEMNRLVAEGVITVLPCRGGVTINTPKETKDTRPSGLRALQKMGLVT